MGLVQAFVSNPVKVSVGVILIVLFGGLALVSMPMQLTPEVQTPTLTIETTWPGASPQEVEREIVQEQEEQLKSVEGVTKMSSECMDSMGRISLEFSAGQDMAAALLKVNTRLAQVREYPEDANEPVINTSSSSDNPIAWLILRPKVPERAELEAFLAKHPDLAKPMAPVLAARSSGLRNKRLRAVIEAHPEARPLLRDIDMAQQRLFTEDYVEARFERVPGVSNSNVLGGSERELQVVIDPQRLAARGLTIREVRGALQARNADASAGDFWEGKRRYVVRTLGRFRTPQSVESVLIAENETGPVYVRDVAKVHIGYKKATGLVRSFGETVLAVNCVRETGANVMDVMAGIRTAVDELNAGVLASNGLMINQVYDETDYITSAVGLVQQNILLGGSLTILVLLLFLRSARSTLVIALAIPTSVIGTFLLLSAMGRSLNVISLAGLAFAVGMLVDNAVVVLENIYRHYQAGERRLVAAVKGTQEVWGAVVASTLTTLAVFLPILFVKEEAGQLFRDIALAISCSVGLSLLVSVTVIPTATARILSKRTHGERRPSAVARLVGTLLWPFDALGRGFVGLVDAAHRWLERGPLRQVLVFGAVVGASVFLFLELLPKTEYLPQGNRNLAIGILLPPPGLNLDQLTKMGETVEERIRPNWDVDVDDAEAIAKLQGPAIEHFFFVVRGRSVFLGMRAHDPLRAGELVPTIQRATQGLPGTFGIAQQTSLFERGLGAGRTVDIEITGPDLPTLVGLGGRIMGAVAGKFPRSEGNQFRPIPSLDLSNPEVHVEPRWERASELGISAQDLGYAVNSLVDGAYAGDYYDEGDKIDLTLLGDPVFAGRFQDLESLPMATPAGDSVPLRAVADIVLTSGPEQINRRERERTITISVTPSPETPLEAALDTIEDEILAPLRDQGALAPPYQARLSGTADKLTATLDALKLNLLLAIVITYLLMAALFESWMHPFVIIFSVPLGAVGGILGLTLLNRYVLQNLDVLTMIGFIILIGTVVNNAILIVHQSLVYIRKNVPYREAVRQSVRTRIRPIFMTTMTTTCGLLPLVINPGAGSELYRGLGSILLGGLVVSTFFTLLVVPTLFRLMLMLQGGLGRLLGLGDASDAAPVAASVPAVTPHDSLDA